MRRIYLAVEGCDPDADWWICESNVSLDDGNDAEGGGDADY